LFEIFDRFEEVAPFFNAGDYFVGPEFQEIGFFLLIVTIARVVTVWLEKT